MSFCTACGSSMSETDRFCTACGAPRTESPVIHGSRERSPRTARRIAVLTVVFVVACALALVTGYTVWSSPPRVDPAAVEVRIIP